MEMQVHVSPIFAVQINRLKTKRNKSDVEFRPVRGTANRGVPRCATSLKDMCGNSACPPCRDELRRGGANATAVGGFEVPLLRHLIGPSPCRSPRAPGRPSWPPLRVR